jgi:hypothetical protein|nr:MAG TPA: hypothetical protein [Caudoviricetes sp.]
MGFPLDFEIEDLTEEQKNELREKFLEDVERESTPPSSGLIPYNFLMDEEEAEGIKVIEEIALLEEQLEKTIGYPIYVRMFVTSSTFQYVLSIDNRTKSVTYLPEAGSIIGNSDPLNADELSKLVDSLNEHYEFFNCRR